MKILSQYPSLKNNHAANLSRVVVLIFLKRGLVLNFMEMIWD